MIKTNKTLENGSHSQERGNAMVYVLIAIALFGFLTVAMSRQNNQADGQDLSDEQVDLYVNELINYVAAAQQAADMMLMSGSEVDDLIFLTPSDGGFDTAPHFNKLFHPSGGGLVHETTFNQGMFVAAGSGWYINDDVNVEWTPSTAKDVTLSALRIPREVCENINLKITGSTTIPILTTTLTAIFSAASYTNDLTTATCSDCEGFSSLCVAESTNSFYGYYNVIAAQ